MKPIRLFAGYDAREAIGFHVFVASLLERASVPVAVHALDDKGLPVGSNAFTFSRFLVPWLCGFEGHAIFADGSDMLLQADIAELDALFDPAFAVQLVQHRPYKTGHKLKYRFTSMQCPNLDYARKNWTSLMLMNCSHPHWQSFRPETIRTATDLSPMAVLQLTGLADGDIGVLPDAWNRLVDEGQPADGAKVLHFTAGIPAFPHYATTPGAEHWFATRDRMLEIA